MTSNDYFLCGWRVRSALPIPELIPWPSPDLGSPDITVEEGMVPERLENSVTPGRYLMIDPSGTIFLEIAGHVRFLIEGGRRVTVQMLQPEARTNWRTFFLGAVIAYLCHQRGVFPLHAATLQLRGRTLAIAGARGEGKSTLAFTLNQRGHLLLSDDLTVLHPAAGRVETLPAFPRLKLWRNALDAAGMATDGLHRVRPGMDKFDVRPQDGFDMTPRPLDAIIVLAEGTETTLTKVAPTAAFGLIIKHTSRRRTSATLGHQARLFTQTGQIVSSVPVYQLSRPLRFEDLPDTAALIERTICP